MGDTMNKVNKSAKINDHVEQHSEMQRNLSSSSLISLSNMQTEYTPDLINPEEEEKERESLQKIVAALKYYRKYYLARVNKTVSYLNTLPEHHQKMLAKYRHHLNMVRDCIDKNQMVIKKIIMENKLCETMGSPNSDGELIKKDIDGHITKIRHQDMEHSDEHVEPFKILKAQSTLKAIARDWSAEGAKEREQSYKPIIDAIEHYYDPKLYKVNEIKVLVPGCGLGRLTYELACRGYDCEGNEFSYFMLIASNFVLNKCTEDNMYVLYPWVHQNVNNLKRSDQVAAVRFPDVCPNINKPIGQLSISAGDFLEVYQTSNNYHCVATCFFIDCANNIVEFIETIYRILLPGSIWVNLGPLLYHFSDIPNEQSIEPTYEDLMHVINCVGFEVLESKTGLCTKYAQNPNSMLKSEYESLFWICRKPTNAVDIDNDAAGRDNLSNNAHSPTNGYAQFMT